MKTKLLYCIVLTTAVAAVSTGSFAQVKIGTNPTTITPNTNLDVEGANNKHMVVTKDLGYVGVGTTSPTSTFQVQAVANIDRPAAKSVIAQFEPAGGVDIDAPASITINGQRAVFGYQWDSQASKYAFIRGNQATDVRLQVSDASSISYPNALVVSSHGSTPGWVGLNNEAPQAQLDVRQGGIKVLPRAGAQTGNLSKGTSNMNGFEVVTPNTNDAYVAIQRSGDGPALVLSKTAAGNGDRFLQFVVNDEMKGMVYYNGSGVSISYTSDQRLKENIRATKFGLDALKKVKIYDYNFKTDSAKALSTGVLAQELHKIYPQAVRVGGADAITDPWQVDYSKLVPVLVQSVQELNQKVESLESEKAKLSAELTRKEAAYAELDQRLSQVEQLLTKGGKQTQSVSR